MLSSFERELGVRILERSSTGVCFTEEGLRLYPHFQEMVYCFSVDGSDYRFLCNGYKNLHGKLENMGLKLKHITNF